MTSDSNGCASTGRRQLLANLATLAGGGAVLPVVAAERNSPKIPWDDTADVLVVGSGAAGTAAALAAADAGASVIILEKQDYPGGTTAKSAGVFWIPNNPWLREQGIVDEIRDALRYMVRMACPEQFLPDHPTLGIAADHYELLNTYVTQASPAIESLIRLSSLKIMPWRFREDALWPDYFGHLSVNKVKAGRSLVCDVRDGAGQAIWPGGGGAGNSLVWQLQQGFRDKAISLRLEHRVRALVRNDDGAIIGIRAENADGQTLYLRSRRGVVFGTGGFTHDVSLANNFLRGRIWGGCAAPGSTGDFVPMAAGVGARFGNMQNAWWAQVVVERAIASRSLASNVWSCPGDSSIQVNRYGRRFVNEKIAYNERAQTHFHWDPVRLEFPNQLGFLIWDERTAQRYAGYDPVPPAGVRSPQVLRAASLADLTVELRNRLARIAEHTGGLELASEFESMLEQSIRDYNEAARSGRDAQFHRGETANELAWQFFGIKPVENNYPNPTMHPISNRGPYYAVILGAGTLDTKGGPVTDSKGRVLNNDGAPIAGLFAAGNCAASPAAQAYWGGGGTIGPALTFGFLAGQSAASGTG